MAKETLHVNISGMTCVNCSNAVKKVTMKLPGVEKAEVSFASNAGEFVFDNAQVSKETIKAKIKKLGYGVLDDAKMLEKEKASAMHKLKQRFFVAVALSIGVMALAKLEPFGASTIWAIFALASIVQFYSGAPFYTHGFSALRHGNYDMNVLVALGTSAAYGYSLAVMLFGAHFPESMRFVYFDGAVMIISFVLLGKFLEERSKAKATDALKKLLDLSPTQARLREGGKERMVDVKELVPGNTVIVKSGEAISCDGEVKEGDGEVDTSMITGEPLPVHKRVGDSVVAGTINRVGYLKIEVTKRASETMLAGIVSLLSEAQNQKMPIGRFADKISNIFVPAVIGIAILTFLAWWGFSGNMLYAFLASVSVLIISCPCALGLATPIAIVTAVGRGASNGILLKNPEVLEIMKEIKYAIFDKTGTLTKGEITVTEATLSLENLRLVALMETKSEHPISKAVVAYAKAQNVALEGDVEQMEVLAGRGIKGVVEGISIVVGNQEFLEKEGAKLTETSALLMAKAQQEAKGAVVAAIAGEEVGCFILEDTLKPEAKEVIDALKAQGITPVMLTGDHEETAKQIAKKIGIDLVYAGVLPHEKHAKIETFQKEHKVLFVGDGINDSASLKQADVGMAMNSGSDIAKEAGDIVLMRNDLHLVTQSLFLSGRTMRTIKQNLFWAFIYNILGIPLAAGVLYPWLGVMLTPMYASMAMSISSVTVVLNALRLKFLKLS
jgi:Cu+-exporting ATPase